MSPSHSLSLRPGTPPPPLTHTHTQCTLQVGSLSVSSQTSQVLVSQPGGTYLPLAINKWALQYDYVCLLLCQCREGELESRDLIGQPQRRNPTSSTSLVANITDTVDCDDLVALCTLDGGCAHHCVCSDPCTCTGTVRMVRGGVKQWELQVDHSLFSIQRLDITASAIPHSVCYYTPLCC